MYLVSAREMQAMDAATIETFGIPGRVLMENAGRGATRIFLQTIYRHHPGARVAVVAGPGNNGGDGFVMARYLAQKQIPVKVYLLSTRSRVKGDAAANLGLLDPLNVPVKEITDIKTFSLLRTELNQQEIWIDAILGTGLSSDVKGFFKEIIEIINGSNRPVFSVDIPSGLNSDTGQPCGVCIKATATATFAFAKIGHLLYPGADFTGNLSIIEIGIPSHIAAKVGVKQHLISHRMIQDEIDPRNPETHKGSTGHLLVLAGSKGKTGAATMTTMGALKSGAGLVTLAVADSLNAIFEGQLVEAMTSPLPEDSQGILGKSALTAIWNLCRKKRCLALGPGLGTATPTSELVLNLIKKAAIPLVIDADGLNILSQNVDLLKQLKVPVVLTPHPGEMSRLIGKPVKAILQDKIQCARFFAQEFRVHLILKGAHSVIAHPDGQVYVNPTGNPGMATGGMGDVLTGIVAGLIVQGYEPGVAARVGTFLHGAAADSLAKAGYSIGLTASQVMERIPLEINKFTAVPFTAAPSKDPMECRY